MKRSDWDKISQARELLQLEETATLKEIKNAFRRMCKKHHPDVVRNPEEGSCAIQEVNEAYDILLKYCSNFSFPLTQHASGEPMEVEDWWMDRFGQDPLWGKKSEE